MTYRAELAGLRNPTQVITAELKIALSGIGLRERRILSEGIAFSTGPIEDISFEIWLKEIEDADDDAFIFYNGSVYNDSADAPCNAKKSRNVIYREVSYGHVVVEIPSDYWQDSDREELADKLKVLAWINKHVFPSRAQFAA